MSVLFISHPVYSYPVTAVWPKTTPLHHLRISQAQLWTFWDSWTPGYFVHLWHCHKETKIKTCKSGRFCLHKLTRLISVVANSSHHFYFQILIHFYARGYGIWLWAAAKVNYPVGQIVTQGYKRKPSEEFSRSSSHWWSVWKHSIICLGIPIRPNWAPSRWLILSVNHATVTYIVLHLVT